MIYFILSLPAIADEIYKQGIQGEIKVFLGEVSYRSLRKMKHKFREYFIRDNIKFSFNGSDYAINIVDCRVYPQGYAAKHYLQDYKMYQQQTLLILVDILQIFQ